MKKEILIERDGLLAPESYWSLSPYQREKLTNWCGPKSRPWLSMLIPDNLLGVDMRPACSVHDYQWGKAKDHNDFAESDAILLCNATNAVIRKRDRRHMRSQTVLAMVYYFAVRVVHSRVLQALIAIVAFCLAACLLEFLT